MQHLFLPPDQFEGDKARILGADHLHLTRVLRARVGEPLVVLDGRGNAFRSVLVSIEKNESVVRLEAAVCMSPEPAIFLTIAQALGKGDKFEQVVQHGTEAGASAFVPIQAERCVVDVPDTKVTTRVARWQQIAKSAAEQSGRALVPPVTEPVSFARLLAQVRQIRVDENKSAAEGAEQVTRLLLHPAENALPLHRMLTNVSVGARLTLAIGPEGGWSPTEVSLALTANMLPVTLGPRILRTETAALVAISQIMYHFDNLHSELS